MRVAFVGWRGMVGSVLLERMRAESDFDHVDEVVFFSTSNAGGEPPIAGAPPLGDAHDVAALAKFDVVLTCQGGSYTKRVHPQLRDRGWQGYWIDAASALRMEPTSVIVLDPVNGSRIEEALESGSRDLIGGNCTVSLMLMAMAPLFQRDWVEWLSSMTYQAASGAGAQVLEELVAQYVALGGALAAPLADPAVSALELDRIATSTLRSSEFPREVIGQPLGASLLPWVDSAVDEGSSREEWKGHVEANKILGLDPPVPVDGLCVRVGSLRCHSQALTIKLRSAIPLDEIEDVLAGAHEWTSVVPNEPQATLEQLTPAAVGGRLEVPVGRLKKLRMGDDYLAAFTVGDQLLWGAAEPLRRSLRILVERQTAVLA